MKRFLRITSLGVFGKEGITKQDLVDVLYHSIDSLVDTHENKYFDADNNQWKEIQ